MSNSMDPDQARHLVGPGLGSNCLQKNVGPDLGSNCLQKLSADDTSR